MADTAQTVETLSKREAEVAAAYADGASYKVIARDLGISPTTVRSHLRTVYGKLNVTSKIALAQALADPSTAPADARDNAGLTADLALELDEAMRRERMMTRVLRIISQSGANLNEVIDEVLEQALEICEAEFGILMEHQGDYSFTEMRSANINARFANWLAAQGSFNPGPHTAVGRAARTLKPASVVDVNAEEISRDDNPLRLATVEFGRARSLAAIPMTAGGRLIGVFSVYRTRVHPFNDRALELAQAFADQAAIAIENTRQISSMETRLEQAAATREILDAISRSRDDERPVFDTILGNARKLCDAPFAALVLGRKGDVYQTMIAHHGAVQSTEDIYSEGRVPMDPERSFAARAILEMRPIHLPNMMDTDLYRAGVANVVELCDLQGIRTNLFVPLIKDGEGIGCFIIFRHEVRPYSAEQIALVETFATQAVIALENVRQFRDLQKRLDLEAATSQILGAISASRNDDKPVFHTILKNACRVCNAQSGFITVLDSDGEFLTGPAQFGTSPEFALMFDDWTAHLATSPLGAAQCIRERRAIAFDDIADTDLYRAGNAERVNQVDIEGMRSILCVPLLTPDTGLGSMILYRKQVQPFSSEDIAMVEAFAAQAVIAIENASQFRALQARTSEVQMLNASLEAKVEDQVGEIERMGRLKRFLPSAVADTVISSGSEQMLQSHRALLGVLFCDIRGFTSFCETAEPEETIDVLQTYHEEMGKLINAHGAGVDLRMGDGVMVLFNDPIPCDDPAGDAVRLAIAMRERMADLCGTWKRMGYRLGFGVGVSLGYATVGMVGFEGRFDYTASGTAINLASRLCDEAEDGEILLSPKACIAVEDRFHIETRGEIHLKGLREPLEVFRLAGPVAP